MKLKYIIIILVLELLFIFIIDNSYALDEDTINNLEEVNNLVLDIKLENIDNKEEIYNFIDLIDDSLIPTATFNMSDKLNDNYDFLTNFAINFILNNEEYYKDNIVVGEEYIYNTEYSNYTTNKYIDINTIYDITYNVLGKKNYYIVNDYLTIENNLVPLLLTEEYPFFMEIEQIIDIIKFSNNYEILIKYKDIDLTYKYIFEKIDNNYIVSNLEVY